MKKAGKIISLTLVFILISAMLVIILRLIGKIGYDMKINNINQNETVIAIANDMGPTYRFILSENGKLTVSYGRKKNTHNEDDWGNIISRKFMDEVFIEESVWLPDDVHDEMLSLIDEFIHSGATDDIIASADMWHFVVLTTDEIYRASRKCPQSRIIAFDLLTPLLSEWSPIVVEFISSGAWIPERK